MIGYDLIASHFSFQEKIMVCFTFGKKKKGDRNTQNSKVTREKILHHPTRSNTTSPDVQSSTSSSLANVQNELRSEKNKEEQLPGYSSHTPSISPSIAVIERTVESISEELLEVSKEIHYHPELAWEEFHTMRVLTSYLKKKCE
jgi:hypothetical protein